MMRAFAWWGINRSTSSGECPFFSRTSRQDAAISVTARLNTSRPFGIWIRCREAATVSADAGSRDPPAGSSRISAAVPSAPSTVPSIPGRSLAWITVAPAPSPNSTHVCRSVKSRIRLYTSAPINKTVSAIPDSTNARRGSQTVGEACARRVHVEGRAREPELLLDPHRGRRERGVPGDAGAHDHVELLRRDPGRAERDPRGLDGEIRGHDAVVGEMTCLDAGAASGSTRRSCRPAPRTTCWGRGGEGATSQRR